MTAPTFKAVHHCLWIQLEHAVFHGVSENFPQVIGHCTVLHCDKKLGEAFLQAGMGALFAIASPFQDVLLKLFELDHTSNVFGLFDHCFSEDVEEGIEILMILELLQKTSNGLSICRTTFLGVKCLNHRLPSSVLCRSILVELRIIDSPFFVTLCVLPGRKMVHR